MKDFLFELTATLKLGPMPSNSVQESDVDLNEFTNSSNDSDRTIVFNGEPHTPSEEQSKIPLIKFHIHFFFSSSSVPKPWSSVDRTMEAPLHQTNRLYKRFQTIRE